MAEKIKAWSIKPGKEPELIEIENELKPLQDYVGGYIEAYNISITEAVICNEEGRIMQLPYNCYIEGSHFFGDILIVGVKGENFCSTKLNKKIIKLIVSRRN